MPAWIFVCIWIIWGAVSIQQVNVFRLLAIRPSLILSTFGKTKAWIWIIASVFWIGYNTSLLF